MPNRSKSIPHFSAYSGELELDPDPSLWSAEDIMICTAEAFLTVEERVRRALAMYRFRLLSVQGLPVHKVVVARFSASDNIGFYLRSLARVLSAALTHQRVSFEKDSVAVSGTGRRGQLAFVLIEPFDGEWARRSGQSHGAS